MGWLEHRQISRKSNEVNRNRRKRSLSASNPTEVTFKSSHSLNFGGFTHLGREIYRRWSLWYPNKGRSVTIPLAGKTASENSASSCCICQLPSIGDFSIIRSDNTIAFGTFNDWRVSLPCSTYACPFRAVDSRNGHHLTYPCTVGASFLASATFRHDQAPIEITHVILAHLWASSIKIRRALHCRKLASEPLALGVVSIISVSFAGSRSFPIDAPGISRNWSTPQLSR
jgi:hypothetical protein